MQITCKCLNVIINSRGSIIDNYDFKSKGSAVDHSFFNENIGCVELESIHKEQAALVAVVSSGEWVIHRCLNCNLYTHALNTSSSAVVLVNRALLIKPQDIAAQKSSDKYSPVFHIVINCKEDDNNAAMPGVRGVPGSTALHQQLKEWLQREASLTEERVRQYSEQQYAALDQLRSRAHRDHLTLTRILVEASNAQSASSIVDPKKPQSQFSSVTKPMPSSPLRVIPVLPDPTNAILKKPIQVPNRARNLARKPSVDAEGLFDLDGMDDIAPDAFPSDEELSDTDDSGSHDEGIHIPRHLGTAAYAKSLPVDVPAFMNQPDSDHSLHTTDHRVLEEPMDIAASIKALAKSVHGDSLFGDLPRPRFSSQI